MSLEHRAKPREFLLCHLNLTMTMMQLRNSKRCHCLRNTGGIRLQVPLKPFIKSTETNQPRRNQSTEQCPRLDLIYLTLFPCLPSKPDETQPSVTPQVSVSEMSSESETEMDTDVYRIPKKPAKFTKRSHDTSSSS